MRILEGRRKREPRKDSQGVLPLLVYRKVMPCRAWLHVIDGCEGYGDLHHQVRRQDIKVRSQLEVAAGQKIERTARYRGQSVDLNIPRDSNAKVFNKSWRE
jgi:hypothetical protein